MRYLRLHRIQALLLKYWFISCNSMDRMFDVFYWPLIGLVVFGFTTEYVEEISLSPTIFVYLLGGLILWVLFERVQQDVTVFILEDFWSGNVANSFITPVTEAEIFVSVILLGIIRAVVSFAAMFLLAFFAYSFNLFQGGFLALLFVIPLFLFGWGLGILVTGLIFRYGMRIQIFAWSITYLLQPVAAAFYPLATLPGFLQKIAYATPLMYSFEGFRLAYNGEFSLSFLALGCGLALLYMMLSYLFFISSVKSARRKGLLAKH